MVTMAYGRILPKPILEIPSLACLNIHASLLPRHRGASRSRPPSPRRTVKAASPSCTWPRGSTRGDVDPWKNAFPSAAARRRAVSRRDSPARPGGPRGGAGPAGLGKGPAFRAGRIAGHRHRENPASRHDAGLEPDGPGIERRIRSLQPRPGAVATLMSDESTPVPVKVHSAIVARRVSGRPGSVLAHRRKGDPDRLRGGGVAPRNRPARGRGEDALRSVCPGPRPSAWRKAADGDLALPRADPRISSSSMPETLSREPKYRRIVLKISGEALEEKGSSDSVSPQIVRAVAASVAEVRSLGVEVAVVVGEGTSGGGWPRATGG